MYKKVKLVFFIVSFITFIILTISYYFSDQNIKRTNKSRSLHSLYSLNLSNEIMDIPLLRNDTDDVINYKNDVENYIKKKKNYTFRELLKKNDE